MMTHPPLPRIGSDLEAAVLPTAYAFYTWPFCTSQSQSHPQICRQHWSGGLCKEQTKGQVCTERRLRWSRHQSRALHTIRNKHQRSGRMKVDFQGRQHSQGPFSTVSQPLLPLTVSEHQARTTFLMNSFFPCELLHYNQECKTGTALQALSCTFLGLFIEKMKSLRK